MAERYIGIDFGTSTSLIRVMQYEDGKPIEKSLDPKPVTFKNGQETTVPTRVRMKEGAEDIPPDFGHAATRKRGYVIHENFKTDLESSNPEVRARARKLTEEFFDFMGKTYRHQSECGLFGNVDDKVHTIVSYPVKWSEDTRSFMVEAARKAGFPDVTGMDEAKAAIQAVTVRSEGYLLQKGLLKKEQAVTILLIDMGAGTTDLVLCSYTPGKNAQILSTWPKGGEIFFGGKEIDAKLQQFFRNEKVIEPLETLDTILTKLGSSEFKAWKEETVSPALENEDVVSDFNALEDEIDSLRPYIKIVENDYALDRSAFEKILGKDLEKFPQLVNGCLADAKVCGSDVDLVILTGGHSQWYFVKEMLAGKMHQYGKLELTKIIADPSRIIQMARPQETVTWGLVYTPLCSKEIVEPEDLFQQGKELEKSDPEKANELYLQAAEFGHAGAMKCLGYNCKFGIGMTKNIEKSVDWYRKAADLGYAGAMNNLGVSYENGEGVSKNQEKANELYQKAAELGDANGMYNFALSNLYGKGIPANPRLALEWLEKAAALGQPSAKKYAEAASESDFDIEVLSDSTCAIKKYKGSDEIIKVPAFIRGKAVVEIGEYAFKRGYRRSYGLIERIKKGTDGEYIDQSTAGTVILPDSVRKICKGAFEHVEKLRFIIAKGVREIEEEAFRYCFWLEGFVAGKNVSSIGEWAFSVTKDLAVMDFDMGEVEPGVIYFPQELRKIGNFAFFKSFSGVHTLYVSNNTIIGRYQEFNVNELIRY